MHDWPNSSSPRPTKDLARDIAHSGTLFLTAGELGERFGIQRLTANARARIADDMREAGLRCAPALADAKRTDRLTISAVPQHTAAPAPRRSRRMRWLVGVPALLVLLILVATASGGKPSQPPKYVAADAPETRPAAAAASARQTTPATAKARPIDDTTQVRAKAEDLASAGRWIAAATLLHNHDDDAYADNLARRGARRILRSASHALRAGSYGQAKALAARAARLSPSAEAADIRRSAIGRAAARKKAERLARDRRFCSASEKDRVDYGSTVPAGCGAYARQKRAEEQALQAPDPLDSSPSTDSGSSDSAGSGGGFGCDGDPGATPYPQFPGQRDGDGDGCYGES